MFFDLKIKVLFQKIYKIYTKSKLGVQKINREKKNGEYFSSTTKETKEGFYLNRIAHRYSDHCDSGGNASAGIECRKGKSKRHFLPQQSETGRNRAGNVRRGL